MVGGINRHGVVADERGKAFSQQARYFLLIQCGTKPCEISNSFFAQVWSPVQSRGFKVYYGAKLRSAKLRRKGLIDALAGLIENAPGRRSVPAKFVSNKRAKHHEKNVSLVTGASGFIGSCRGRVAIPGP